jgi:Protein  of unknown function (DUF3018)
MFQQHREGPAMGKHEVIRPSSTERVRKHRAEMRAKGYRLKQVWVPDRNDPVFKAELARGCQAIADFECNNPDEVAWMNELADKAWTDLPD